MTSGRSEEQRTWRALRTMSARLDAQLNRDLQARSGLSLADYDVLVALSERSSNRMRVFALAACLGWEQSRLSHHLARMARRDLVARDECEGDKRGAFVVLTKTGRRAITRAAPRHVETVRKLLFDEIGDGELAALNEFAGRVLGRLETLEGR